MMLFILFTAIKNVHFKKRKNYSPYRAINKKFVKLFLSIWFEIWIFRPDNTKHYTGNNNQYN